MSIFDVWGVSGRAVALWSCVWRMLGKFSSLLLAASDPVFAYKLDACWELLLKPEKLQVILNFVDMLHHDYNSKHCDWVTRFFSVFLEALPTPVAVLRSTFALHLSLKLRCMFVCSNLMFRFLHAVKANLATEHRPLLLLSLISPVEDCSQF